jgi:hypothetical protein
MKISRLFQLDRVGIHPARYLRRITCLAIV